MTRRLPGTLALLLIAASASAGWSRHGTNVRTRHDAPTSCSDLEITIDGRDAVREEQVMTFALPSRGPLTVHSPSNSGVYVEASDRRDVQVLVCKAARRSEDLADIRVSMVGGVLDARGPQEDGWIAYLLIQAPRSAALELDASNGPVALHGLTGRVRAGVKNGPISVRDCPGDIEVRAQNGPISFSGSGGNVRATAQNGPISVRLTGSAWDGVGLEARAQNGPISLQIPDGFLSGTVVESTGQSPFRCRGGACQKARRGWDDDGRRVELGSGPTLVHLSTVNGPVTVGSTERDVED